MKSLPAYSIAILATYIMSSVASAAVQDTPPADPSATKVIKPAPAVTGKAETAPATSAPAEETKPADTTPVAENKPAAPAAETKPAEAAPATETKPAAPAPAAHAPVTHAPAQTREAAAQEIHSLTTRVNIIATQVGNLQKAKRPVAPADAELMDWVIKARRANKNKTPYEDAEFRKKLREKLTERDAKIAEAAHAPRPPAPIPAPPIARPTLADSYVAPDAAGAAPVNQGQSAEQSQEWAEKRAELERLEAAYQKCTSDCAAVRDEAERLRTENADIKNKLAEEARARAAAEEQLRLRRAGVDDRVARERADRDRDRDLDTDIDGRRVVRTTRPLARNTGRNQQQVLGNLYGNGNNGQYDPFSLQNPNLFGANGMQNPYANWQNQQRMLQMQQMAQLQQQPYGQNLFGMNQGRQLPGVYPAPGGGFQQQPYGGAYPQQIGGYPQQIGGYPQQYGAYPQQFGGAFPQNMFNRGYAGGAPIYAGAPFQAGYGAPGAYGVGGGIGYGLGGQYAGGYGAINRGVGAPPVLPYQGGGVIGGGGYAGGGYGLGAQVGGWNTPIYNGGQQYAQYTGRSLPNIYPAPR